MVYKKFLPFLLFLILYCTPYIYACRYTVREIGYADFGHSPYILYIYIDNETDQGDVATIKKLYNTLLTDSNIEMNIVNVDDNLASGAIEHFNNHNIKSYPSAQLVLHDNKAMSYPIYDPGKSLIESVWLLFENLASSSKRNLIKERLLEAFCVVLIIEGKNQIQNSYVLSETQKAVEEISQRFEYMPKKVNSPPVIISLTQKEIHDEEVLLSSMGISLKDTEIPSVIVLYGRARIMGSVMRGEQVTKLRIFNLLTIIGADCECDLDYSWILGDMIPLRWDYQDLEKLAEQLDFNVENPMVKSEMSQILSLKPNPENAMNPMENNLLGYTEGDFGLGKDNIASPKISASEIRESFYPSDSHKTNQVFKMLLITLGGIIFIVLIISGLLLIRHKQRKI